MIQVPKMFQEQQDALAMGKIKEAKEKLDKFLEEEGLFVGAIMDISPTGLIPTVVVMPKEFLKSKKGENKKEEESKILPAS